MERGSDWELDLLALLRALWRQRLLLIVAALLGAELSLWAGMALLPPRYSCRSLLYVKNNGSVQENSATISSGELSAAKSLVDSYRVILRSRSTLEQVIRREHLAYTPEELAKLVECSAVDETEFFQLLVQSSDREEALAIATCLTGLLPEQLRQVAGAANVTILDPPAVGSEPVWPRPQDLALLGGVLGLGAAGLLLSYQELRHGRLRREDRDSFPTVGELFVSLPPEPREEDYRLLALGLRAHLKEEQAPTLLALAPLEESRPALELALGLSKALGQSQRVLLVEGSESCGLSGRLALPGQAGLRQVAQGRRSLAELLQSGPGPWVDWLPAGGSLSPAELEGQALKALLSQDQGKHSLLLLLLPPLSSGSEAYALAMGSQGLLLVAEEGRSRRAVLRESLQHLQNLRIPVLGLALVQQRPRRFWGKNSPKRAKA